MLKRPLNARFSEAVLAGRKITTIRDTAWPVGKTIILFNWSGSPYRSPHSNVAAVKILATSPITILKCPPTMFCRSGLFYTIKWTWPIGPIWQTEGFHSQEDMDEWFTKIIKPGHSATKHIMRFELDPPPQPRDDFPVSAG